MVRNELKKASIEHRPNSADGEIKEKYYLRINNTNISPEVVAQKIKTVFNL